MIVFYSMEDVKLIIIKQYWEGGALITFCFLYCSTGQYLLLQNHGQWIFIVKGVSQFLKQNDWAQNKDHRR